MVGIRSATGRPALSAPTLAAAETVVVAGSLMAHEWLTPRSWLYGPVFWHARAGRRVVALAFDNGPCYPYTGQLFEVLDREEVKATFFQVGNNVRREPNLGAKVVSGHAVGNHTFNHPHLVWSRTGTVRDQLQRDQEAIHDAPGTLPALFRVPTAGPSWPGTGTAHPRTLSTASYPARCPPRRR